MNAEKWFACNASDLTGKTVAITGSTGGLGRELCEYFAQMYADLLMLNRNEQKTAVLSQALLQKYPQTKIDFLKLDQADFVNLQEACDELRNRKIDYLVLNAGAYNVATYKTSIGFNNIFQINFFSPYCLVRKLLPSLRKNNTKVIVVSSLACGFAKFDENDFDYSNRKSASKIYGNAKRFLTVSLQELLRLESDITLSVTHPGVTATDMLGHYPKAINWFVKSASKVVFMSPHKAALNVLYGCFCDVDHNEWVGPRVFGIWGYPKKTEHKLGTEIERQRIFETAERLFFEVVEKQNRV